MVHTVRNEYRQRCHSANSSSQFWGKASFSHQTEDVRNSLMAGLHGRSDIEWAAGNNWCLVCEKGGINNNSLSSCDENALHVAVAGKAWPLGDNTRRDAQLVADLYQVFRDGVINQCDGQFAAVIIDEKNSRVILTINWPGGFNSLYFCTNGCSLFFATRLDLLIHRCGWRAQVNEQAIVDLLRFGGFVNEISLIQGINRVIPGFAVVFEKRQVTQSSVYKYPLHEDYEPCDTSELKSLHQAAMQKLISGYKDFGLFLSGGLDSGLNVAVAAGLSTRPVKTFSAVFDSTEFDESFLAQLVAKKYNTEHHEILIDTAGCLDRLPEMVWAMQEPILDSSYIPTFYVAEAIKKHVDVAIGGDGPDHFLGRYYQYAAWYDLWRRFPCALNVADWSVRVNDKKAKIRHSFWKYVRRKRLGRQLWHSLACATVPCGSGILNYFCDLLWGNLPPNDIVRLLSPDLLRRASVATYNHTWLERWRQQNTSDSQSNFILADASLDGLCGVFAKVGTMCSAHNLIIHEPYLTTPIIKYFYGLKNSLKVDGSWYRRLSRTIPNSQTKCVLRRAATGCLPNEIILQKQKRGFDFPLVQSWQQSTYGLNSRQIFAALLNHTDWFDPIYLDRLVREQALGARNHRHMLLLLAGLDQWFRIFMTSNATPPSWRWSDCF